MGALGDLLAQQRTQAASTSTPQRRNLNVNAEPRIQAADVRVDGSAGTWTWCRRSSSTPHPGDHPGRGLSARGTRSLYKTFTAATPTQTVATLPGVRDVAFATWDGSEKI